MEPNVFLQSRIELSLRRKSFSGIESCICFILCHKRVRVPELCPVIYYIDFHLFNLKRNWRLEGWDAFCAGPSGIGGFVDESPRAVPWAVIGRAVGANSGNNLRLHLWCVIVSAVAPIRRKAEGQRLNAKVRRPKRRGPRQKPGAGSTGILCPDYHRDTWFFDIAHVCAQGRVTATTHNVGVRDERSTGPQRGPPPTQKRRGRSRNGHGRVVYQDQCPITNDQASKEIPRLQVQGAGFRRVVADDCRCAHVLERRKSASPDRVRGDALQGLRHLDLPLPVVFRRIGA